MASIMKTGVSVSVVDEQDAGGATHAEEEVGEYPSTGCAMLGLSGTACCPVIAERDAVWRNDRTDRCCASSPVHCIDVDTSTVKGYPNYLEEFGTKLPCLVE